MESKKVFFVAQLASQWIRKPGRSYATLPCENFQIWRFQTLFSRQTNMANGLFPCFMVTTIKLADFSARHVSLLGSPANLGEMIQVDEDVLSVGWFNHPTTWCHFLSGGIDFTSPPKEKMQEKSTIGPYVKNEKAYEVGRLLVIDWVIILFLYKSYFTPFITGRGPPCSWFKFWKKLLVSKRHPVTLSDNLHWSGVQSPKNT